MKFIKKSFHGFKELKLSVKIALIVGLLPLLMIIPIEATSTTDFCDSCHIMNDYHASWEASKHAEVNCLMCHLQPGFSGFVTGKLNGLAQLVDCVVGRVGTKPNGSITDASCLREGCHSVDTLNEDKLDFQGIKFRHSKHINKIVDGINLKCDTCHSHFEGHEHFSLNKDVCYTCHFLEGPEGKGRVVETNCQSCHEVPKEVIKRGLVTIDHQEFLSYNASCEQSCHKNEISQLSQVDDASCLNCHSDRMQGLVDANELHMAHSTSREKVECFACHGETTHARTEVASLAGMMDCQSCHSDTHQVQRSLYSTAMPAHPDTQDRVLSPMFMTHVACTGCHIEQGVKQDGAIDSFGTVARAVPRACDTCHAEGTGLKYIPFWQDEIKTLHARITERSTRLARRLELTAAISDLPAKQALLTQAQDILNSVVADGSWGVHNFKYTERLLLDSDALLSRLERQL
ncbi:MAG: NapC/NirT family cytochrome c [Phycisphaerae bacterium]|nr:NapC/NirT family cytochrome c [Phycisphaerae bacterium]